MYDDSENNNMIVSPWPTYAKVFVNAEWRDSLTIYTNTLHSYRITKLNFFGVETGRKIQLFLSAAYALTIHR